MTTNELAHRADQAGAGLTPAFTPDPQRAMLALGLHPQNPLTHAALLLANTYGLDPLLGHIKIIPGKGSQPATIWVTRDGYLFKAKQHPEWDGLDLVEEDDGGGPPDGVYFCRVICRRKGQPDAEGRAWYKWKQAKGQGGHYIDENADEMCLQRAERRALRRQFPLSIFEPALAGLLADDGEPTAAPAPVVEVARRVEQTAGSAAHSPPRPTEPVPTSEVGEREGAPDRHDPASDDQSPEPNPAPTAVAGSGGPRPSSTTPEDGKPGRGRQDAAKGKRGEPDAPAGPQHTSERGAATDAMSPVKQAGSASPAERKREDEADPSLLPEPPGWER
jgi:hypothetical protein